MPTSSRAAGTCRSSIRVRSPPEQRRRINVEVTRWLNECLGLSVTDAFCGFKAYRTSALRSFEITDDGYAMPLQVWVQAAAHRDEDRGGCGPADLPGRVAGVRRRASTMPNIGWPTIVGSSRGARSGRDAAGGGVSGMTARRLRAPATDGGLLAEPPLAAAGR